MKRTPALSSWSAMRQRCNNPADIGYANYGGRGIRVCERWAHFANFLADMGERPDGMWLDRIDSNGHYEPGNCRWLSPKLQNRNRRDNMKFDYQGAMRTIPEIAEMAGLKSETVRKRLCKYGYTLAQAVAPVMTGGRRS